MPARLLIYETTHHETLPAMLDLAALYFEKVTVFLREITYQNICRTPAGIKWKNTVFVRQSDARSNRAFIRDALHFARHNDISHFHISTLDNNMLYFAMGLLRLPKPHISLSIHAVNEYRKYKAGNLRDLTESLAKLFFHRRIGHYRVLSPGMIDIFHQKFPGTNCQFIPSRFFAAQQAGIREKKDYLKIIIPGSVDPNRRDYAFVVSFVKDHLSVMASEKPIELVFLGEINSPYGLRLVDELKVYVSADLRFRYYFQYVPQREYEQQLAEADILWSPVHINTLGTRGTPEIYGLSKSTGLIADLLFNCRPALVPAGFDIPEHYVGVLIPYDSPLALADLFREFFYGVDENKTAAISHALSFFSKENFGTAFRELLSIPR